VDFNTLDANAILGEWPNLKGLYLAIFNPSRVLEDQPIVEDVIVQDR
jgi:hypothetical protein